MMIDSSTKTALAGTCEPDDPGDGLQDGIAVGDTIGRFVVLRSLGEGTMGVVYAGYDVELDRKVALKVIRGEALSAAVRERSLREAQALARLSHPNVVQIYEAGRHQRRLFVAMEYIDGQDLRWWLETSRRPWRAVLSTICAAGRGLAAAHAIGLVHRDVKPDNMLVGADGRARIADFGLVRAAAEDDPPRDPRGTDPVLESVRRAAASSGSPGGLHLTQEGRSIGTPAYMAPEQHRGRGVDARSDQFGFCVTLYEGLYGARPFTATTIEGLQEQVARGQIPPPPAGSAVPRWIHRLLVRGLRPAPEERWPSMDALLDALAGDPRRKRRMLAGVVLAAGLIGGGAYALASARAEDALRCRGAARKLEGVWDPGRRAALSSAWAADTSTLAAETGPRVALLLDTYAERWTNQHDRSCEAHRRGEMSPLLLDRTMACLQRRHLALGALVEVLIEAGEGTIANAVAAASDLPRIEHCGEAEALLAAVPPPEDPARAAEVEAIRGELARVLALEAAGRYVDGLALVDGLEPRIEAVEYAPLVAELHLQRGRIQMWAAEFNAAVPELHQAFVLGLEARADETATEALVRWIYARGYGMNQPREALSWEPVAQAMVRRLTDHEALVVLLAHNTGPVLELGGDLENATTMTQSALDGWVRIVGRDHLQTLYALNNLGMLHLQRGRCAEGERAIVDALAGMKRTLGASHPSLLMLAPNRCSAYDCLGSRGAAISCFDATIKAMSDLREFSPMAIAVVRMDRAELRLDAGDLDGAEEDLLWIHHQATDIGSSAPKALVGLARIDLLRGEAGRARARFQAAVDMFVRTEVPEHLRMEALAGLGEALLASGEVARAQLEESLRFAEAHTKYPWLQAPARFALALALAAGGEPADRARARALAEEASDGYATGGHYHDGVRARITRFLAELEDGERP